MMRNDTWNTGTPAPDVKLFLNPIFFLEGSMCMSKPSLEASTYIYVFHESLVPIAVRLSSNICAQSQLNLPMWPQS